MTSVLKPGLLVSLKTSLEGGVTYERRDLAVEADPNLDADPVVVVDTEATVPADQPKADVARWETTRVIEDAEEHKRAVTARNAAGRAIRSVCTATSFGLLCNQDREAVLDKAVAEARALVDAHNATAKHTRVSVYVLKGRIASTDEEAARAIASEVRGLLSEMEAGIRRLDVEAVREAASRAKKVGAVLDETQAKLISEAVVAARDAARQIVRRVEGDGEAAEKVLAELSTSAIEKARFAFLDLEEGAAVEALPAVNVQRAAELDFDGPEKLAAPTVQLEIPVVAEGPSLPIGWSPEGSLLPSLDLEV